jgi:hypothetical protein
VNLSGSREEASFFPDLSKSGSAPAEPVVYQKEINMISIGCRELCSRLSHEKAVIGARKAFENNTKNDTIVSS